MTLAAIWRVGERVYAAADTRIVRERGNVHTEHGPKLLPIMIACRQPGPDGEFSTINYRANVGYAYAGATLPALATHALANILFQKLVGAPEAPPPSIEHLASAVAGIAYRYMLEVGQLSGPYALFSAIIFGFCPRAGRFRAFRLNPTLEQQALQVVVHEHDLYAEDTLIVIGSNPDLLRDRVRRDRPGYFSEETQNQRFADLREIDLPKRSLEALIREGADDSVGGAVQSGWLTRHGFEVVSNMIPIVPPLANGRNAALTVLGFDLFGFNVGEYIPAIDGR